MLFAVLFSLALSLQAQPAAVLRIVQLDVGQGDAALIVTPERRSILIDAGPSAQAIARALARERIDTLDLVIATHNHADHIGGMPEVLARTAVRFYLDGGVPHTTQIYRDVLAAVEREPGLQYLQATPRRISIGSVHVHIIPPPQPGSSLNNNSVGVMVELGEFKALLTGDSEEELLAAWLKSDIVRPVQVLKVAHHGSENGTTREWALAMRPKAALISVGARNSFGHPSPRAEAIWSAVGARVYRTDLHGDIEIRARADGTFEAWTRRGLPIGVAK